MSTSWMDGLHLLAFAIIIGLVTDVVNGDDGVIGCGGFVRLTASLAAATSKSRPDLSVVKAKLVTEEGLVKSLTECAPNGYYFIPIYDKGSFKIRVEGPAGWEFDPNEVSVSSGDDSHLTCDGKDVDFQITGFGLSGQIKTEGHNVGPAGVEIALLDGDRVVKTAVSGEKGGFTFHNMPPGKYSVRASHPHWKFRRNTSQVEIGMDCQKIEESYDVVGYRISGEVKSEDEPIYGVSVFLFPADKQQKRPKQLECEQPSAAEAKDVSAIHGVQPWCKSVSDAQGKYSVVNVPPGKYQLVPIYKGEETTFDVHPDKVDGEVGHGDLNVTPSFQVRGFSTSGRVVDSNGGAVAGAVVLVDGTERAVTDANGRYTLDRVTSGSYVIEVVKEHIFFDPLTDHRIVPHMPHIDDIVATGYHLCGVIKLDGGLQVSREVSVREMKSPKEERTSTDAAGKFCFEVAPGKYIVQPIVTDRERAAGLFLTPVSRIVEISTRPVLDVAFSQASVTVSGSVECMQSPCDPHGLSFTLSPDGPNARPIYTAKLGTTAAQNKALPFVFHDVAPGSYKLSVEREGWCWEKQNIDIEVGVEDIKGVQLKQSGYQVAASLTHKMEVHFKLQSAGNNDAGIVAELNEGVNTLCLNKPGVYTVTPKACFRFESSNLQFDTNAPKPLAFVVTHYLVSGKITVDSASEGAASMTVQTLITNDASPSNSAAAATAAAASSSSSMDGTNTNNVGSSASNIINLPVKATKVPGVFEYEYWAAQGDRLQLSPSSPSLLFYPPSRAITVSDNACPPPVEDFKGRPGLFLKGSVSPALEGVEIVVSRVSNAQDVALRVYTGKNGKYVAGPLYDDEEYSVAALMDGFSFKNQGDGNFKAQKLGEIHVSVADDKGEPLQAVLVSLSRESFRSNNATPPSGILSFTSLFPGEYFMRPLLKEYVFQPGSTSITVDQGGKQEVKFVGVRVAFSVRGKVRSLDGEAEKSVDIEAISVSGEEPVEETKTDATGQYRLRGLKPGKKYSVRVKANSKFERASPAEEVITMGSSDVNDVDFITIRKSSKHELSGTVHADGALLSSLKVVVSLASAPETPLHSIDLGVCPYFIFPALPKETYLVKVVAALESHNYNIQTQPLQVQLASDQNVQLEFSASVKDKTQDRPASSFFILFVAVFIGYVATNREQASEIGRNIFQRIQKLLNKQQDKRRKK